jgi:hypothetical protein
VCRTWRGIAAQPLIRGCSHVSRSLCSSRKIHFHSNCDTGSSKPNRSRLGCPTSSSPFRISPVSCLRHWFEQLRSDTLNNFFEMQNSMCDRLSQNMRTLEMVSLLLTVKITATSREANRLWGSQSLTFVLVIEKKCCRISKIVKIL